MKKDQKKPETLDELLAKINDENRQIHGEVDFGRPVGKEILPEDESELTEWKETNKSAIADMNKFTDDNGLLNDKHREFGNKKK